MSLVGVVALNHNGDTSIVCHVNTGGSSSNPNPLYKGKNVWEQLPNRPARQPQEGFISSEADGYKAAGIKKEWKKDIVIN